MGFRDDQNAWILIITGVGVDRAFSAGPDLKERIVYSAPISSYQAIKHKCADICTSTSSEPGRPIPLSVTVITTGD